MLQEIQNAANKPEKVFIDSRQLKICCTCFDLTVALLRVLEMVIHLNPHLITRAEVDSADLILPQLCTLLNQILNRVTTTIGCFEFVTDLEVPGLEPVAHFPLLSAVCGILIGLTLRGSQESRDIAAKAIVTDASFLTSNLLNLRLQKIEDIAPSILSPSSSLSDKRKLPKRAFQLTDFTDVSEDETVHLDEMITVLVTQSQAVESSKSIEEISDEDMCTICYATKKTAIFEPCGHKSCR